jgi:hypothetical protein
MLCHTVGLIAAGPAKGPVRKHLLLPSAAHLLLSDAQQKVLTASLRFRGIATGTPRPSEGVHAMCSMAACRHSCQLPMAFGCNSQELVCHSLGALQHDLSTCCPAFSRKQCVCSALRITIQGLATLLRSVCHIHVRQVHPATQHLLLR